MQVLTYLGDSRGEQEEGQSGSDGAGQHGQGDDEVENQPQSFEDRSEHVTLVFTVSLRHLESVVGPPVPQHGHVYDLCLSVSLSQTH